MAWNRKPPNKSYHDRERYKRAPFKVKLPTCGYCGEVGKHYSWLCLKKPNKALRQEAPKSKRRRQEVAAIWFQTNPPDERGFWTCYLQISPLCPRRVNRATINLEHVKPRSKNPELKYDPSNIRPACESCNKLKASWTLEQLAETYPQIRRLIQDDTH